MVISQVEITQLSYSLNGNIYVPNENKTTCKRCGNTNLSIKIHCYK